MGHQSNRTGIKQTKMGDAIVLDASVLVAEATTAGA